MRKLDRKIIMALLLVVVASALLFIVRSSGTLDAKPGGTTMLETPPLPTKPPLE